MRMAGTSCVLCLLALLGAGGCAAPTMVAAGASLSALEFGVTTWNKGQLSAAELGSMDETHAAALRTLRELGFEGVKERRAENGRWTTLTTVDGQNRQVTIRCSRISPAVTKLKFRVGLLGDEAVSLALHRQVNDRLREERAKRAGSGDGAAPGGAGP